MEREILLLGDPRLYEKSEPVRREELPRLQSVIQDLGDTLRAYRARCGAGRAIAAPQIGTAKRMLYLELPDCAAPRGPMVLLNPVLTPEGGARMTVLDDCMSFPGLWVRVERWRRCSVTYRDAAWNPCVLHLQDDLSELLQHECDHLDGVLATMRAVDGRSFFLRKPSGAETPEGGRGEA